jgi:ribosome-binding protein aMBF1 (putative translation factor)
MGTKFSDYLAKSKAADTPEDAALREAFAASIALGLQFRDARVERGLTQVELSEKSGVSQADISRIERGAGNPTESTLQRLASVLRYRLELVDNPRSTATVPMSA